MSFYRKKPVVVETHQYTKENGVSLALWVKGEIQWDDDNTERILIPTLEGDMKSHLGDYIVKDSQFGEFWSVKREIFEATYEKVEDENG